MPSKFEVHREITINAPPQAIHPYINELFLWPLWSPWEELDPTTRITLGEPSQGIGANQTWTDRSGGGELVIIASDPLNGIRYDARFGSNREHYPAELRLRAIGPNQTQVRWQIQGKMTTPIMAPFLAMMANRMIGDPFQQGLAKLKWVVEERQQPEE
ncbi:SRPBCC family protein [Ferrimonas pelagia]|uniref:SRPBCC family protein n=1 Tax=Ferrimonas pelagia TaxID=1177826 RepID=UPI0031E4EB15